MARQSLRTARATAAQLAAYIGPSGEPITNTDTGAPHWQDGQTPGGVPLARRDKLGDGQVAPRFGSVAAIPKNLDALFGVEKVVLENHLAAGESTNDVGVPINRFLGGLSGKAIILPASRTNLVTPITTSNRCAIIGAGGSGKGPAPGAHNTEASSTLMCFYAGDGLKISSIYDCILQDFALDVWPDYRSTSGTGLTIQPGAVPNSTGHTISNVRISNFRKSAALYRPFKMTVEKSWFDGWTDSGLSFLFSDTTGNKEGTPGSIIGNTFWGSGSAGFGLVSETGYFDATRNHFLNGRGAIKLSPKGFPAGAPRIYRNTLEEQYEYTLYVESQDGSAMSMLAFDDNELSVVEHGANFKAHVFVAENGGVPFLTNFSLSRNTIRSVLPAGSRFFQIQNGDGGVIYDNLLETLTNADVVGVEFKGATTQAGLGNVEARGNKFVAIGAAGWGSRRYVNNASTPLRGVYVPFSPPVTSTSGAISSVSSSTGFYRIVGDMLEFQVDVTIGNNGTGSGNIAISLPFTSAYSAQFSGKETGASNVACAAAIPAGSNTLFVTRFDGAYPGANNARFVFNGTIRLA